MLLRYCVAAFLFVLCSRPLLAVEPTLLAKVGDEMVTDRLVQRELSRALQGKLPDEAKLLEKATAAMLRECVQRELVLQALVAQGEAASSADVDLEVARLKQQHDKTKDEFTRFLHAYDGQEAALRRELLYRLSWSRYLAKQLNDANLQRYFENHQADYDGTQVKVAHILFHVASSAEKGDWEQARQQAAMVRDEIVSKKQSFANAAKQYSRAQTAAAGGDLGAIHRHQPMPEAFSAAAFALKPGEVSPPVETAFGVHLIQCQAIVPGDRPWTDSRQELEAAVTRYLFDWLSQKQAKTTKVEYFSVK